MAHTRRASLGRRGAAELRAPFDYTERLFGPGGEAAIMADVQNFVDLS